MEEKLRAARSVLEESNRIKQQLATARQAFHSSVQPFKLPRKPRVVAGYLSETLPAGRKRRCIKISRLDSDRVAVSIESPGDIVHTFTLAPSSDSSVSICIDSYMLPVVVSIHCLILEKNLVSGVVVDNLCFAYPTGPVIDGEN
ncbi:MAG: hypothetical protein SGCHY_002517, partial [Lobulomycetales sp.]